MGGTPHASDGSKRDAGRAGIGDCHSRNLAVGKDAVSVFCVVEERDVRGRVEVKSEIRAKEAAVEVLVRKYTSKTASEGAALAFDMSPSLDSDDLRRAIYSLADNNSYLAFCRSPIDEAIALLRKYFK